MRARIWFAVCLIGATAFGQRLKDLRSTPALLPDGATLVVGFLGGFERWNDEHRSVRKLVLKLRSEEGVYAESISNRQQRLAVRLIRRAFDRNRDGILDADESARARVVLFGQSLGGSAVVRTARALRKLGVPVLLTVQVDSVGLHDAVIPSNVAAAVNFYQRDPLTINGRREIRAEDPARTRILGNFAASYLMRSVPEHDASWVRRKVGGSHAKMEMDPEVWSRVERYVRDAVEKR